jgi:tetratricopeptide (TPR) repeat protein
MMLMPILPLFLVMAWVNRLLARRPDGDRGKTGGGEATGWFARTAEWHFVLLILVPCFLYLFLFKSEIGMARDWDLFTMSILGLVPLALLIVNRFFRATRLQLSAASFTVPAIAIYAVLTLAWVGINASPTRSAVRFEHILEYDRTHAAYAYETLAIFYHDRGDIEKATELMEITCEISNNPRQLVRLGMYYQKLEGSEKAIELMRQTIADHPNSHRARFYLITLLEAGGNWDEIAELARAGTALHPNEAIYWFYHGEVSISKGRIQEGLAALQNCLTLNPPEKARQRCIEQIQKYSAQEK